MNFNEDPTDSEKIEEEVKKWVSSAKKEIKIQSLKKGLIYNYDFSKDQPMQNSFSRLLWDPNPLSSTLTMPKRSSSVSQPRSSRSTAVTLDYELMDYNLPSLNSQSIEIIPSLSEPQRLSSQFCLFQRRGSLPILPLIKKSISRSNSF